ncbi:arsenate reductase (glutaredoxin) [Celeribacter arenosi]|uniref:Arsenate reductase n=1 Tax=Celeribacter arenosi TaxID=792649 RepID=A0ABP7KC14_9RHOB
MAKIYHNPRCSTSRKALALLREAGQDVEVIEYLKTPPTRAELAALIAAAGETAKSTLRAKQAEAATHNLTRDDVTEDDILDAMIADPILINRPFVTTARGTRLCRPLDKIHDILPETGKGEGPRA